MSNALEAFSLNNDDAMKLLICESHIGSHRCEFQMEQYIWKRRNDGTYLINVRKTWEKLLLAARAIAAVENPADVCVISARTHAQRALLKYASHTGATPICGRFTPGSLTNQFTKNFKEPRLIIVSDPRMDHQAVTESSYVNIPVIAFCNTDSPLKFIDVSIPCNNKGHYSIGLMWWLLAREVLQLRGTITRELGFTIDGKSIMPDLYFYRDPQEQEKEEPVETREKESGAWPQEEFAQSAEPVKLDFQVPHIEDWAAASSWTEPPAQSAPAPEPQAVAVTAAAAPTDDWGANSSGW